MFQSITRINIPSDLTQRRMEQRDSLSTRRQEALPSHSSWKCIRLAVFKEHIEDNSEDVKSRSVYQVFHFITLQ